jgi:hypothetical protein
MKIRARANGNILDVSDDEGKTLIELGIYEPVEDVKAEDDPSKRTYKRRDLKPEP